MITSIGKLLLFVASAEIYTPSTTPIFLDLGTSTQECLNKPLYFGTKEKKFGSSEMLVFMEGFMFEIYKQFPRLIVHFGVSLHAISLYKCSETFHNQ